MNAYAVLGALLGLPLLLGLIFRVNTSHLFFSLMAGELLARYFGHDVTLVVDSIGGNRVVADYAPVAVILLPVILTAFFLKGTISKAKLVLHFIPLLITGVVLTAFMLPELPSAAQEQIKTVEIGRQLLDLSTAIVGGVVFVQLISLWLLNRAHGEGKGHGKKHHG